MKTCKKCGVIGDKSIFYKNSAAKDGLRSICIVCDRTNRKKYYSENKEIEAVKYKKYAEKNATKIAERKKETRQKNVVEEQKYAKEYYLKNKEKRLIACSQWYEKNKDDPDLKARIWEKGAKRRVAKINAVTSWADRYEILKVYLKAKVLTKYTGIPHEVDHIIPLQGKTVCGLHVHTNLQILTKQQNSSKRNEFNIMDCI